MEAEDSIIIDGLVRPERLATVIAQSSQHERDDLAELVATEQKPGSFGELVKNAIGLTEAHQEKVEQQGSNVVSFYRKLNSA